MKKYIKYIFATTDTDAIDTSVFESTPFKPDTGTSYYNNFLNSKDLKYMQEQKNTTGAIVMMSPNTYFKESAEKIFKNRHTVQEILHSREYDSELNEEYTEAMKNGSKFPLCYLNYADDTQEGLHRMMVAGNIYGWQTAFPVLVVTVFDQAIEDRRNTIRQCDDFLYHEFHSVCEEALDSLIDWKSPPPDDFEQLYRSEIIRIASNWEDESYDIDVEIEITPDSETGYEPNDSKVDVFLTKFNGYELPTISYPFTFYLSEYFKISGDSNNQDIDDIDLLSLFLK